MTYQHALRYLSTDEPISEEHRLPNEELRALCERGRSYPLLICFSHDKQASIAARLMRSTLACAGVGCLHVIDEPSLDPKERFILDGKPLTPTLLCPQAHAVHAREVVLRRACAQKDAAFPLPERTATVLLRCCASWNIRVVLLESNQPTLLRAFVELGTPVSLTAASLTDAAGQTAISTIGPTTAEVITHAGGAAVIRALSDACARYELRLTVIPRAGINQRAVTLGSQAFDCPPLSDCRLPSGTALARDAAVLVVHLAQALRHRGIAIADDHLRQGLSHASIPDCLTPVSIRPLIIADRIDNALELGATLQELETLATSLPTGLCIRCEASLEPTLTSWAAAHNARLEPSLGEQSPAPYKSDESYLLLGSAFFLKKCAPDSISR